MSVVTPPEMFVHSEEDNDEKSPTPPTCSRPAGATSASPPRPDLSNSLSQHKERSVWMGNADEEEKYVYGHDKSTQTPDYPNKNAWEFTCGCCNKLVNDKNLRYCKQCMAGYESSYAFEAPDTRWRCSHCGKFVKGIEFDFTVGVCKIHLF